MRRLVCASGLGLFSLSVKACVCPHLTEPLCFSLCIPLCLSLCHTNTTATSSAHLEDLAYLDEQRHTPLRTSLRMPRQSTTCGPGRSGQDLRGEQRGGVKEHTHKYTHCAALQLHVGRKLEKYTYKIKGCVAS